MRPNQLLLLADLTRALHSVSLVTSSICADSGSPSAHALTPIESSALAQHRQTGKITEWDPFGRHGVIQDAAGHRYRIANTRAFETVLPTMLRTLEGAVVEFDVDRKATADRVIVRSRLDPITAESYRLKPPVNFLSAELLGHLRSASRTKKEAASVAVSTMTAVTVATANTNTKENGSSIGQRQADVSEQTVLFAKNIKVDFSSITAKQIARWSGPLSEEEVIKPTKNLKDMRSSRVFDRETNAYLKLKQQLGSSEEARRLLEEQRERVDAEAPRREVVAVKVAGIILAWSGIHRSGLIREASADEGIEAKAEDASAALTVSESPPTDTVTSSTEGEKGGSGNAGAVCIIRNVYAFQSALPTSQSLVQRRVTFTKVTYSTLPNRFFAESIEVKGVVKYDNAVPSLEEAHTAKQKERAALLRSSRPGALVLEDSQSNEQSSGFGVGGRANTTMSRASHKKSNSNAACAALEDKNTATDTSTITKRCLDVLNDGELKVDSDREPIDPNKMHYGVVVRWSGGQGVVEGGDGRHYFLRSAAEFVQLVDQTSHQLRGAVVQFKRDPAHPRYAREVDILSIASTTLNEVKPMLERTHFAVRSTFREVGDANSTTAPAPKVTDVEPEGVEWIYGTLLSWSSVEGQGIVISDVDNEARYVLRDPDQNVVAYATKRHLLKKGRQVKFTTFGSTGRLVCNLVLLDSEIEEEALREEELRPKEPKLTLDGNMSEAIPSPMSTSYWLKRMDKAGYDTKEVKDLQNRALTLDEDDDDGTEGGKFLDSEELLKKDHWWSDPRKNIRFPNSDMTAGHLALIGPASMMNVAMKAKDPKKLDKMLRKYQSRLTEDQKEYAWKQAKEMAPKYEECIRKGRERNEEPKFYFF